MQIGPLVISGPPLRTAAYRLRAVISERRAIRRAWASMPRPVDWEWAEPRLVPLLAGPRIDLPGEPIVRVSSALGPALVFGIDLDGALPLVDADVAARWERTPADIERTAMANLRRRAARVSPRAVVTGTMYGRVFRRLRQPRGFASSLILLPEELARLFGPADQILATPANGVLLSYAVEVPRHTIVSITVEMEDREPFPLFLDPFAFVEGAVIWNSEVDGLDEEWEPAWGD